MKDNNKHITKGYVLKLDSLLPIEEYDNLRIALYEQYKQGLILLPKGVELIDTYEIHDNKVVISCEQPNITGEQIINLL